MCPVTWVGFVWKNLMRRPARTALTAAGMAIGVGLIVALLSIAAGVRKTAGDDFTFGDIPVGCMAHRWLSLPIERPAYKNLLAWYDRLKQRRARVGAH